MRLGDWLKQSGKTQEEFGALIGADTSTVSRYISGERMPSLKKLTRISDVTGGVVTATDFVPDASVEHCGAPHRAAS